MNDLIWKEIQEKNAQFKADNDAYWEAEQVYRKWYAEERKRRYALLSAPFLVLWLNRAGDALPLHSWAWGTLQLTRMRVMIIVMIVMILMARILRLQANVYHSPFRLPVDKFPDKALIFELRGQHQAAQMHICLQRLRYADGLGCSLPPHDYLHQYLCHLELAL